MSGTLIWTDRLRIERACVDFHTATCRLCQCVPRPRSAASCESTLRAASADVGTKEALRRLGNVRTMAADHIHC